MRRKIGVHWQENQHGTCFANGLGHTTMWSFVYGRYRYIVCCRMYLHEPGMPHTYYLYLYSYPDNDNTNTDSADSATLLHNPSRSTSPVIVSQAASPQNDTTTGFSVPCSQIVPGTLPAAVAGGSDTENFDVRMNSTANENVQMPSVIAFRQLKTPNIAVAVCI